MIEVSFARTGCALLAVSVLFAGCKTKVPAGDGPSAPTGPTGAAAMLKESSHPATPFPTPPPVYVETGDLDRIASHKILRIITPRREGPGTLPRAGFPFDVEKEVAEDFAKDAGLEPVFVYVESYDAMVPALLEGKGDVLAANLTVTDDRKKKMLFTVPVGQTKQVLVTRDTDKAIKVPSNLQGRKVAIRKSAAFYETVTALQKRYPKIQVELVPENVDTESILHYVATGEYDTTVADTNIVDSVLGYETGLRVALELTGDRPKAWAVRPDAVQLKKALDKYLNEQQLGGIAEPTYTDDLDGISRRKVLRVITRNSAASYFLWRGELLGFEYELTREFAKQNGLRLEVVVPPTRDELFSYLRDGKGDVVAASLTASDERAAAEKVKFTRAYNFASKIVVGRVKDTRPLKEAKDLAGRTVVVRKSSSYWPALEKMKTDGIALTLVAAPEDEETEEIIGKVGAGTYDVTIADSPILDIELTWRTDVTAAFPLGEPLPYGWAVRPENAKLLAKLDAFIKEQYKGAMYNIAYRKYFKDPRVICEHVEERSDVGGKISKYDDLVQKYSAQFGFDWRLVSAQMYQESRFDPQARSWVGAMGLMQVMPKTAAQFGFQDVRPPDPGVHAGVQYLGWVRDRFDQELPTEDRMWFALAAYNAGDGHVEDARRIARERKLDPDRWFGNVELAMLDLSKPEVARKARFGYCRGAEPVNYVREIRDRFEGYAKVIDAGGDTAPH
jgi:membrane-bound lytic murein transglycosylase F